MNHKPCPNPFHECGTDHIRLFREPEYGFQMQCRYCGIATDWCESAESATEEWNDRPATVSVEALKDVLYKAMNLQISESDRYTILAGNIKFMIDQVERREDS